MSIDNPDILQEAFNGMSPEALLAEEDHIHNEIYELQERARMIVRALLERTVQRADT